MKQKLLYYLGNTFLLVSLFGFIFTFFPFLTLYSSPPPVKSVAVQKGAFLTIPKINAQAPVVEHVDPWNEKLYNEALKKGVAHAKGTVLPGAKGTSFLFAHSSGNAWEMTRFNTIFWRLGELEKGDRIEIVRNGKRYDYQVREKKEVLPIEVSYLLQTKKTQLILQTCTPIGTSLKRLLVFADPI